MQLVMSLEVEGIIIDEDEDVQVDEYDWEQDAPLVPQEPGDWLVGGDESVQVDEGGDQGEEYDVACYYGCRVYVEEDWDADVDAAFVAGEGYFGYCLYFNSSVSDSRSTATAGIVAVLGPLCSLKL